jgi:hypothetical protein
MVPIFSGRLCHDSQRDAVTNERAPISGQYQANIQTFDLFLILSKMGAASSHQSSHQPSPQALPKKQFSMYHCPPVPRLRLATVFMHCIHPAGGDQASNGN